MEIPQKATCTSCNDVALRILDHESYLYDECGLPNVVLFGLTVDHCQGRNTETDRDPQAFLIPHRKLARAVLWKPAALTGELRVPKPWPDFRRRDSRSNSSFLRLSRRGKRSEALRYLKRCG